MHRHLLIFLAFLFFSPAAQAIEFDSSWTSQGFPGRKANTYRLEGAGLGIDSKQGVSLLLYQVPEADWGARNARWNWSVRQGVPATDLSRKGGDDRNIAAYFTFLPRERAHALRNASATTVLTDREARTIIYVWGGGAGRGSMIASPYMDGRGAMVILRDAGTGAYSEQVNLENDYRKAFGSAPDVLFGIGISADSDDTRSSISGGISDLLVLK